MAGDPVCAVHGMTQCNCRERMLGMGWPFSIELPDSFGKMPEWSVETIPSVDIDKIKLLMELEKYREVTAEEIDSCVSQQPLTEEDAEKIIAFVRKNVR